MLGRASEHRRGCVTAAAAAVAFADNLADHSPSPRSRACRSERQKVDALKAVNVTLQTLAHSPRAHDRREVHATLPAPSRTLLPPPSTTSPLWRVRTSSGGRGTRRTHRDMTVTPLVCNRARPSRATDAAGPLRRTLAATRSRLDESGAGCCVRETHLDRPSAEFRVADDYSRRTLKGRRVLDLWRSQTETACSDVRAFSSQPPIRPPTRYHPVYIAKRRRAEGWGVNADRRAPKKPSAGSCISTARVSHPHTTDSKHWAWAQAA